VITKRQYYLRLKDMIEHCDNVCSTCPMWEKEDKKWKDNVVILDARDSSKYESQISAEVCVMCRDFLTKWKFRTRRLTTIRCPCIAFGEKKAIEMAKEAIARYERGEHRWQKEGQSK